MANDTLRAKLTPAGKKLLLRFIDAERNTIERIAGPRLSEFRRGDRSFLALRLSAGDGAAKAAGKKLQKEGFAEFGWRSINGVRYILITPKGREALSSCASS